MSDEAQQVKVGQIVGTHGVKGGLKVYCLTDFRERFEVGQTVFLRGEPRKIVRSNWHKDQARIQLKDLNSISEAEALKWDYLTVPADSRPDLEPDEYLERDLIGMSIVTEDGVVLGQLEEILPLPAHDVLKSGEIMIPVVKEFVRSISLAERTIVVRLIPGMLPDEEVVE